MLEGFNMLIACSVTTLALTNQRCCCGSSVTGTGRKRLLAFGNVRCIHLMTHVLTPQQPTGKAASPEKSLDCLSAFD